MITNMSMTTSSILTAMAFVVATCLTPSVGVAQNTVARKSDEISPRVVMVRPAKTAGKTRSNCVVFLTDTARVREMDNLFRDNRAYAHKCGVQWYVSIWANATDKLDEIPISLECERFEKHTKQIQAKLGEYISHLESSPSTFLYNMKIPTAFSPSMIVRDMGAEQKILFMYGTSQHLPSVTFRIVSTTSIEGQNKANIAELAKKNQEKALLELQKMTQSLKSRFVVEAEGKVLNPVSGVDDKLIEDVLEITLKFQKDTDLDRVGAYIVENGGNVQEKKVPEFYYVQIVSNQRSVLALRDYLQERYNYIRDLYEFPQRR
jgi:hypothetical protein